MSPCFEQTQPDHWKSGYYTAINLRKVIAREKTAIRHAAAWTHIPDIGRIWVLPGRLILVAELLIPLPDSRFLTKYKGVSQPADRWSNWHTFRHTYATLLKGNGEDVKVVQELMRHANISVTLNVYAQAITQTKRDAQSRVVSLLLDKNEEKPSTEAYRTVTDLQNSGEDLQVVNKVGVPDGI